jgi:hypothetical protein
MPQRKGVLPPTYLSSVKKHFGVSIGLLTNGSAHKTATSLLYPELWGKQLPDK